MPVELLGKTEDFSTERQKGFHGDQTRDRGVAEAQRIVAIAEEELGLNPEDWAGLKKGDWRKGLVARQRMAGAAAAHGRS